jgi:hypothetical protein
MNSSTIDAFVQEYNDFLNEFSKKATEKLKEVFNEFWDSNPEIKVVTWTQYAPYFNDGDACVFSVNDPTFSNATSPDDIEDLRWGEYDGYTEGVWAIARWSSDEIPGVDKDSIKTLSDFIQSNAMESVLQNTLGGDNRIVVTREGITSYDYSGSHD